MSKPVLLDNTLLSNFALIHRPQLVLTLWPGACTTSAVQDEYHRGIASRQLPADVWTPLPTVILSPAESAFAARLLPRLGAGERTCIAVAYHRKGSLASDDLDARRQAEEYQIPTTGTIGALLLNVKRERITLQEGNRLLARLINAGYRSPIDRLDDAV
jgi:predicted nucleic acid-binding protein